jgi:PAS domain S-box-containing protein
VTLRVPVSLKLTVPLILLGFAAVLSAVNVLYHVPRAERAAEADVYKRVAQEMSRLQSTLEYLLLKGDLEIAQREISVLAHNHDYIFVALANDQNKVIAATRRAWLDQSTSDVLPTFDPDQASAAIRERRAKLKIDSRDIALFGYAGILMGSEREELRPSRAGSLFLAHDLNRPKSEARAQVLQQSLYWAGWVTALALAMWLAFHFLLTRRTAQLVRAAEQLAAGHLGARSALQGRDELGRLSRAYDAMASEVAATQTRLHQDIAERIRIQQALEDSEASYRAFFNAAEDAIFVHDLETGAIIDVNPKACTSYGYAREEMLQVLGKSLRTGEPPYTAEDTVKLGIAIDSSETQHFERYGRNRDGRARWDEVFVKRVRISGQDRVLVLAREITSRKLAEAALRASEEQYRSMFNASIDGLVLWSAAAEIVDVNPALWKMYGYTQEEFSTLPPGAFIDPSSHPELLRSITSGERWHAEFTDLRKDGSAFQIEVHAVPMLYQGKPHVLTIARDVSEKKRAADELARQREALYQREKLAALGSLLAGVAHELNNPLSVVVARAVMLEEQGDPKTQAAAVRMRAAAERCARIVRTFLAMARQQAPERGPVAINEVVSAALDITAYAVRTSSIEVALDLADDIPSLRADADQLHQVLLNLIINAQQALQDHPPPRRIELTTRFDPASDIVRITVADNGPGIPKHLRARVFDPYFTTKPVGIGTGVGLAVSFGIVEAHGGTLTIDCPMEGGAVFTIALPVGAVDATSIDVALPAEQDSRQRAILVVDDEPEIRETLAEILIRAKHRVVTVSSGRDALNHLATENYDVILTDIRMPDLDGLALFREIKQRWPERVDRVVFVTGDPLSAMSRAQAGAGNRPVIEKPFVPRDVRRVVDQVASQGERGTRN